MRVALGCRDNFPAGQNHLGLDHVAGARPVHAGVVAVPAKQREADVADGGAGPTHDHAAVLRGLVVQLPEVHARAQRHRAADGRVAPVRHKGAVPLGVGQPVRPEEQAAQHGGAAEPVVPGAFDGDGQAVLGGELHRMLGIHRAADAHGFCRGGVGGKPSGPGGEPMAPLCCMPPAWSRSHRGSEKAAPLGLDRSTAATSSSGTC
mmetsp:Transcript_80313/g.209468  ORF Transcript_80313/g.209468 Transcript_80313/m.209468 type:complete len:205 (-) Transcript_80313:137-751(-)